MVQIVNVPAQDSRKDAKRALLTLNEKNAITGRVNNKPVNKIGGAPSDPLSQAPKKSGGKPRGRKAAAPIPENAQPIENPAEPKKS